MINSNTPLTKAATFWGLKDHSFIPRPSFEHAHLYIPEKWILDLNRIIELQMKGSQLSLISSYPNHSKSTIANWLFSKTPDQGQQMFLFSLYKEQHQPGWLLPKLSGFFAGKIKDNMDQTQTIEEVLERLAKLKQGIHIIIDDADKLVHPKAFEEIYSLLSIQAHTDLHLNITLIGNQNLINVINLSKQLLSRVNTTIHVPELSREELIELIEKSQAYHGISDDVLSKDAIESIFNYTNGRIGQIKNLVDHCLYESYLTDTKPINLSHVQASMKYVRLSKIEKYGGASEKFLDPSSKEKVKDTNKAVIRDHLSESDKYNIQLENLFLQDED